MTSVLHSGMLVKLPIKPVVVGTVVTPGFMVIFEVAPNKTLK
jgi:hypothetical protein